MPEGDTIAWAANRLRPVLEGRVLEEIRSPRNPRWRERLPGRAVRAIDTHGKHLFIRFGPRVVQTRQDRADWMSFGCFAGELVLHSHLGMTGSWRVSTREPRSSRAWVVLRTGKHWVAEHNGPLLELLTEGRARFDQRLSALGPDVLSPEFDSERFLARIAGDDPTRPIGDALLDQRNLAGIGNIWKAEGCWEAAIDPWRPLGRVSAGEALSLVELLRPRMLRSAREGPRAIELRVYRRTGRPCARCGTRIRQRAGGSARSTTGYAGGAAGLATSGPAPRHPAGDANRTTYWCPGCQR